MGFECHTTEPMKSIKKHYEKSHETIKIKTESFNSKNISNFRKKSAKQQTCCIFS